MCHVYCREFKGWCKSFTRTEGFLSVLEAIFLAVFIGFLVFLILHFEACRRHWESVTERLPIRPLPPPSPTTISSTNVMSTTSTLSPDVECTWEPSKKTTATRYYLSDIHKSRPPSKTTASIKYATSNKFTTTEPLYEDTTQPPHEYDDDEFIEPPDSEDAGDTYKSQVVALVKLKPAGDATFGCILTKITKFWSLTAASCIESIEEVDALDSFVIMEHWGEVQQSRPRTVADVRVHPLRASGGARAGPGGGRAHDLAALRSDRALAGSAPLLRLPSITDYFLIAIGERFHILGFGRYRAEEERGAARRLRAARVYSVAAAHCGAAGTRHLARGAAQPHAPCGAAPLCAGPRPAPAPGPRPAPGPAGACHYCAGAPLLRGDTLLGIMSDNPACGVTCEPQLYVNIATLRDWIDSVID